MGLVAGLRTLRVLRDTVVLRGRHVLLIVRPHAALGYRLLWFTRLTVLQTRTGCLGFCRRVEAAALLPVTCFKGGGRFLQFGQIPPHFLETRA